LLNHPVSPVVERPSEPLSQRERTLAGLSFAFLHDQMTNGMGGLQALDALLVLAINQANIAPLTRDPRARARYGQLDAPAPDAERRPVSVNAVAGSLGLPFETVRRRIKRLTASGVCRAAPEGVVVPADFLTSPAYVQSVLVGHERLRRFHMELRQADLVGALPRPAYDEAQVPVRAAARLLADYVLRTCEGLMRETGNVIAGLALVALLRRALSEGAPVRPVSVKGLADQLQLPAETVRRHAADLVEDDLCVRGAAGLVMTDENLARPGLRVLFADNAANVHRLMAGLAERGVIQAWEDAAAAAARQESA
jgi:DNA-binding Lrp family transcriptional regulator